MVILLFGFKLFRKMSIFGLIIPINPILDKFLFSLDNGIRRHKLPCQKPLNNINKFAYPKIGRKRQNIPNSLISHLL